MDRRAILYRWLAAAVLVGLLAALAPAARASICIWRNPDQDLREFYPGANTYRAEPKRTGPKRSEIERRIGTRLDPDEGELQFYRILQGGQVVGTVLTHLGRGQYGGIEVVVAFNNDGTVRGVKIQRDRERDRAALRGSAFLDQFKGKRATDKLEVGEDIKPATAGAERSSQTVAFSVKKLAVILDELG